VALLAADGSLPDGAVLTHDSIVGTRFRARVVARATGPSGPAVVVEVEGEAYRTGEHSFVLDPRDPVGTGFVLR
jgi:proline racemase/trans-L-3-hydroxyproline dehydratase